MPPEGSEPICPACGYREAASPCAHCGGRVVAVDSREVIAPGRGFFLGDLLHGFLALFEAGLYVINRPEFFGKLKLPVTVNLITFAIIAFGTWYGLDSLIDWLLDTDWSFLDFLRQLLRVAAAPILTLVALFFLAPAIIEVVTGPFLDSLADTTEKAMAGDSIEPQDLGAWRNMLVGVRATAQILAIQIAILPVCLLLAVTLPAFGLVVVYAIAAALTSLIWFEIPFLRRGQGLRQRVKTLRLNWARALGFGMAFQVGMLIPFFNIFLLTPAAAVATSMLYFHFEKASPSR